MKLQQNVSTQRVQLSIFNGLLWRCLDALIFGLGEADAGLQRLAKIVTLLEVVNVSFI